jgi:hypothetical protein
MHVGIFYASIFPALLMGVDRMIGPLLVIMLLDQQALGLTLKDQRAN